MAWMVLQAVPEASRAEVFGEDARREHCRHAACRESGTLIRTGEAASNTHRGPARSAHIREGGYSKVDASGGSGPLYTSWSRRTKKRGVQGRLHAGKCGEVVARRGNESRGGH